MMIFMNNVKYLANLIIANYLSQSTIAGDPNNDSPLNVLAANLWKDQPAFKAHLDQHYRDPKSEK